MVEARRTRGEGSKSRLKHRGGGGLKRKKKRDRGGGERERERVREGYAIHVAPRKAFLEVAACFAGVDLMNGNVGIIVFTRGTHGGLSRSLATLGVETFIHKAFRAFLSPPRSVPPP